VSAKRERKSAHWPDLSSFFREGEAWVLRQVVFDAALPPMAARVAACVRLSVNFETGVSEVGVSTIAAALGVSEDTVGRCIAALDQRGHAQVDYGRGRGQTHRVAWIVKHDTKMDTFAGLLAENISGLDAKNTARLRSFQGKKNTAAVRDFDDENPANLPVKSRKSAAKTPQECGANIIKNNIGNNMGVSPIPPCDVSDTIDGEILSDAAGDNLHEARFDAIFGRWPKQSGREDARRAFSAAIAAGEDIEAIARGAAAYVTDRQRDPRGPAAVIQFTTPMARWLRERGWEAWGGLPEAEARAAAQHASDLELILERARAREARRGQMLF